jgi:NACHT domain
LQLAYEESGRGDEVNEMMKELSIPLQRLQLGKQFPANLNSPEIATVQVTALNLLTVVVQSLSSYIHYLTDSKLGKPPLKLITSVKVKRAISPGNTVSTNLRMKIKVASENYTKALVDLGVATTFQLSEAVETGFNRLESQLRGGGGLAMAGKTHLFKINSTDMDAWLSGSAETKAKERNKYLSLQESTSPSWIFGLSEFVAWLEKCRDKRNMWLSGTTGFGKSVLAAYLTAEIFERTQLSVVYFFCKDNELLNTADQIVRTIVYQLTSKSPAVHASVKALWAGNRPFLDGTAPLKDIVQILLVNALDLSADDQPVYFILDAVNECPKSSLPDIVSLLGYLQDIANLRIIVTSQPTEEIATTLRNWNHIELHSSYHEKTIESYVSNQLTPTLQA